MRVCRETKVGAVLSRSGVWVAGPLFTRRVKAHPELGRRAEHSPHTPLGRSKGKGEKRGEQRHFWGSFKSGLVALLPK